MIREQEQQTASGLLMLGVFLILIVAAGMGLVRAARGEDGFVAVLCVVVMVASILGLAGLFTVAPNEGRVLQLFGAYRGTAKDEGLRWANPFLTKKRISLRVRNFESAHLKVNDTDGNPIEIAAIVVWKVVDTAEAVFEVDDYEHYVKVQTESAVRNLATHYPYDAHLEGHLSLRGSTDEVAKRLRHEIQDRLAKAGVEVNEARISHLAYAQEIAAAMLRRQQAGAIIAARQKIVEGAVGMVEMALELLEKSNKVHLDEERKAAMVSNLLVVLCAAHDAQPVVNTGTIYQ
ncbi:MAG TPA: SPFH domain-containing protein [Vicinamibacteria bacterium]|nr:SPFH domain-containing protein [Vicinamibacteria bacterium]